MPHHAQASPLQYQMAPMQMAQPVMQVHLISIVPMARIRHVPMARTGLSEVLENKSLGMKVKRFQGFMLIRSLPKILFALSHRLGSK